MKSRTPSNSLSVMADSVWLQVSPSIDSGAGTGGKKTNNNVDRAANAEQPPSLQVARDVHPAHGQQADGQNPAHIEQNNRHIQGWKSERRARSHVGLPSRKMLNCWSSEQGTVSERCVAAAQNKTAAMVIWMIQTHGARQHSRDGSVKEDLWSGYAFFRTRIVQQDYREITVALTWTN